MQNYEQIADLVEGKAIGADLPAAEVAPAAAEPDEARSARAMGYDVEAINREYALVILSPNAVVIKEQEVGAIDERLRILSVDGFCRWFENRATEFVDPEGKIRRSTWARVWLKDRDRRQFSGIEFFPNPDGAPGTPGYLNLWRGCAVEPSRDGSYKIFRDHLLNNICAGDAVLFKYFFAWLAHLFQRPRERIGTAIVLRGRMGTGKTKVGEVVGSLIPAHYFPVDDPRYITGQFNAHMASCLLLQAEEAVWAGDKGAEGRLKGLITSEYQMIEHKGVNSIRLKNYVRLLMTSNEDWVIPAGKDERRFCVLDVDPRCAQNHDYFREMDEELAAGGRERLLYDLLNFDLSGINLREAPRTRALFEQKLRSFDPIESWWYNCLLRGAPVRDIDVWPAQIATARLFADYVKISEEICVRRKRDCASFGVKLAKLVPGASRTRPRVEVDGVIKREWCHTLPSLDRCRAAFEEMVGQSVDWPPSPERESEPAAENAGDQAIPV